MLQAANKSETNCGLSSTQPHIPTDAKQTCLFSQPTVQRYPYIYIHI